MERHPRSNADIAPCLSVVMPVYNEAATIEAIVAAVLAQRPVQELMVVDDGSRDGTRAVLERLAPGDAAPAPVPAGGQPGQGGGAAPGVRAGDGALCDRPGRRPGIRPRRVPPAPGSPARGPRRRGLRLALQGRLRPAGALFLALGGQQVPDLPVEHGHQPQPHRHGDVLQGVPPRGHPAASGSRRTASASSPRSRPRSPGSACASTRSPFPTTAAPTPKARRSAGRTAFHAIWCIFKYNFLKRVNDAGREPGSPARKDRAVLAEQRLQAAQKQTAVSPFRRRVRIA